MATQIRSILTAGAAAVVLAATFATPAEAQRRWRSNPGAAVAAGIVGFAAGAALAGAARSQPYAADPYYNGYYDPGYGYASPSYAYGPGYYGYSDPGYYEAPAYAYPPRRSGGYWQQRNRDERDRLNY